MMMKNKMKKKKKTRKIKDFAKSGTEETTLIISDKNGDLVSSLIAINVMLLMISLMI